MSTLDSQSSILDISSIARKTEKKEALTLKLQHMEMSIKVKELENSLYIRCMKECCNLGDDTVYEKEKNCLENCNSKLIKFREVFQKTYSFQ